MTNFELKITWCQNFLLNLTYWSASQNGYFLPFYRVLSIAQKRRQLLNVCLEGMHGWAAGCAESSTKTFCVCVFFQEGVQGFHNILRRVCALPFSHLRSIYGPNKYSTRTTCQFPFLSCDVFPLKANRWQQRHQPAAAPFSWPHRTCKGKMSGFQDRGTHL